MERVTEKVEFPQEESPAPETVKLSRQQIRDKQRQEEKARDQQRKYYNGQPSRAEVGQQIYQSLEREREHTRQVYILAKSIFQVLLDKNILTEKELEDASVPIHEMLYGKPETPQEPKEAGYELLENEVKEGE